MTDCLRPVCGKQDGPIPHPCATCGRPLLDHSWDLTEARVAHISFLEAEGCLDPTCRGCAEHYTGATR
jgi:hypothetical protein